jgi:hypothetical protein
MRLGRSRAFMGNRRRGRSFGCASRRLSCRGSLNRPRSRGCTRRCGRRRWLGDLARRAAGHETLSARTARHLGAPRCRRRSRSSCRIPYLAVRDRLGLAPGGRRSRGCRCRCRYRRRGTLFFGRHRPAQAFAVGLSPNAVRLGVLDRRGMALDTYAQGKGQVKCLLVAQAELTGQLVDTYFLRQRLLQSSFLFRFSFLRSASLVLFSPVVSADPTSQAPSTRHTILAHGASTASRVRRFGVLEERFDRLRSRCPLSATSVRSFRLGHPCQAMRS